MSLLGELLSIPLDIVNAPIKAAEDLMDGDPNDGFLSAPISAISKQIKKVGD